tara:strand:+ start:1836 stop:2684 length:849 start_codon:yes stop_codon:yes gene_type:complete
MSKMRVGVIGYGFVGKALCNALKKNVKVLKIDPILNTKIDDLVDFNPDICFICVPTPMNIDGSQDTSILEQVFTEINKYLLSSLIVLKSTVLPSYINILQKKNPNLLFNPEFLRENSANEDFINSKLIILGGPKEKTKLLAAFYSEHTKCKTKDYQFTDITSASLVKYSINTFLSTKVTFFNELHQIFTNSGSYESWEKFINIISKDLRIGNSHMQVPGADGKFGFGGPCFPKDNNALIKYSEDIGKPFKLLKTSQAINNKIRRSYESLTDREIQQNISYED